MVLANDLYADVNTWGFWGTFERKGTLSFIRLPSWIVDRRLEVEQQGGERRQHL